MPPLLPSTVETLVDNCDSLCETSEGKYLLCGKCEVYTHIDCYQLNLRLNTKEVREDVYQMKYRSMKYYCKNCRLECLGEFN